MSRQKSLTTRLAILALAGTLVSCTDSKRKSSQYYLDRAESNAAEAEAAEEEVARLRENEKALEVSAADRPKLKSEKELAALAESKIGKKPVAKVDDKAALKSAPKADSKAVAKLAAQPAPVAKVAAKVQAKAEELKPIIKAEAKVVIKPDPVAKMPVAKLAKAEPVSKMAPVAKAAPAVKPAPVAKAEAVVKVAPAVKPASVAKAEPAAKADAPQAIDRKPARFVQESQFVVQIGAFRVKENAEKFQAKLRSEGVSAVLKPLNHSKNGAIFVVRLEPMANRADAEKTMAQLKAEKALSPQLIVLPVEK